MSRATVELTVRSIAGGGEGVGREASGRVVFLPNTAPGDRVVAELVEERSRWARGEVVRWLETGAERVDPPCPLFGTCGGCRTQHLSPACQLSSLRRAVEDALARIGGVTVEVRPTVSAPRRLGYRNRVTFTLRREDGGVTAGYHRARGGGVLDVPECPLAEPALAAAWSDLRAAWGPGASCLPGGGELRVTPRASATGAVMLGIEGGHDDPARVRREAERLQEGVPGLVGVWWRDREGTRHRLAGLPSLAERWQGTSFDLRPEAFVQVNRTVSALLEADLETEAGDLTGARMWDLYAGIGARGIRWARRGALVTAIEAEPDAVETGREAAERAGVALEFVRGRMEDALPGTKIPDLVVANPPRAGLSPRAAALLRDLPARRLAYVACDPATLARDVARLAGRWAPEWAQPYDAFPHTGHVETVLWLRRREERA